MIRILGLLCALAVCATPVAADDVTSTTGAAQSGAGGSGDSLGEAADSDAAADESTDSNSVYRKKVGGILWIEGTVGPSRYVPNKLVNNLPGADDLGVDVPDIRLSGPEFGGAIGVKLGTFMLGGRIKSANYDVFKLNTAALDMGWLIRVPYVHPYIRLAFNYHWIKGDSTVLMPTVPGGTFNLRANGGGVTTGLGIRVPVIKWISISAGVDFTVVGIYIRGSGTVMGVSDDAQGGALGFQTSGTFALTFHI